MGLSFDQGFRYLKLCLSWNHARLCIYLHRENVLDGWYDNLVVSPHDTTQFPPIAVGFQILNMSLNRPLVFLMAMFHSLANSTVELRGARHLLTSQHSLPGIPVALKQPIDLRTSMDGKYKEIAEVSPSQTHTFQLTHFICIPNMDLCCVWLLCVS